MTVVLFKSLYHLEIHIKILMLEIIQYLGFPSKYPKRGSRKTQIQTDHELRKG